MISKPNAVAPVLVFLLVVAMLLTGCNSGDASPREVTLAVLGANGSVHDGNLVATQGRVRSFNDPLHYWIEDEDLNRVEIVPHALIAPYVGKSVRVVGNFTYSREDGRMLILDDAESISAEE
ncbi:hypothetical protein ACLUEY_03135 [Vreelandella aquamarina]